MIIDMGYWSKVIKRILFLLLSIVAIYLAFKLAVFYTPFLIAFIFALLMEPAIRFIMKKTKLHRKTSAILILILVFALVGGCLAWGIATLVSEASNLLQGLNDYFDKAYTLFQNIMNGLNFEKIKIPEQVMNMLQSSGTDFLQTVSDWVKGALTSLVNGITQIPTIATYTVISLLSLYFITTDKIYMLDQLEHHLPRRWVAKIGIHLKELVKTLGCYLKAEAILVLVSFVVSLIGFYIFKWIGLEIGYPLLIALGIGFIDALPILGSGSVMIPWAIICGIDGNWKLGVAIMILWAVMSIIRQLIEPRIVSGQIGIHPIFTLLAMYTGFKFIGVMGMLIGPIILIILKNLYATIIDKGIIKSIFDR